MEGNEIVFYGPTDKEFGQFFSDLQDKIIKRHGDNEYSLDGVWNTGCLTYYPDDQQFVMYDIPDAVTVVFDLRNKVFLMQAYRADEREIIVKDILRLWGKNV